MCQIVQKISVILQNFKDFLIDLQALVNQAEDLGLRQNFHFGTGFLNLSKHYICVCDTNKRKPAKLAF